MYKITSLGKKYSKVGMLLIVCFLLVAPLVVFASHGNINLNLDYPEFGGFDPKTDQHINELVGFLYYFMIGIAGLAAFVMLVWGGVQWLLSGAIPAQASEARDKVRNAILGLLLILASFLVVQILNPELTILNNPTITGGTGSNPQLSGSGSFTVPPPPGSGSITITVNGQPSVTIPPSPSASVDLDWQTNNMSSPTCTGTTDTSPTFEPAIVAQWNFPGGSAPTSGSQTIDLSTASDGLRVTFTLSCDSGTNTIVASADVLVSSGGGTAPTIVQFQVTDHNNPSTWLPGGEPGVDPPASYTYICCGAGTDFPTSTDVRFRWDSINAQSCEGQNKLFGHVNGATSHPGKGPIPIVTSGPNIFTLKCIGTATPDAFMEIIIDKL